MKPEKGKEVEQEVKKEIKEEIKDEMDVDESGLENFPKINIKFEKKNEALSQMMVEGVSDDSDEELVEMSVEEIQEYLKQKISECDKDPKINPVLKLQTERQILEDAIRKKNEELSRCKKTILVMYKNQEKFLRHNSILPKIPTCSVSVSVDLPILPNSALNFSSQKKTPEEVVKADSSELKILTRTVKTDFTTKVPTSKEKSIECIDLTDDSPSTSIKFQCTPITPFTTVKHPAPLPPKMTFSTHTNPSLPKIPPKPHLKVFSENQTITLQWNMPPSNTLHPYGKLKSFEIFGYQEQPNIPINTSLWKSVGGVEAMSLPMACTLTQFEDGNKYHFAVRAKDVFERDGNFSDPISIVFRANAPKKR
ncbi:activating transcription factor 7-interacting protein 1 [Caerostris extrusa]|uniref:Activating transcription factor 7-interacting protein 1 n=1 Tax=Caerostris extrusa TaxID=172846 RepID=A0AAV4NLR2_CAEEX|nr:activating transcription factor 7-interacting protein 1 [Caerostris extrusa]